MPEERGQSMALFAIMLLFVFLPLLAIAMNFPKAIYVRVQLQAATDAACEAAAQAVDYAAFQNAGDAQIDLGTGSGWAYREFIQSVINADIVEYSPSLNSIYRVSPLVVECNASASVAGYLHKFIGVDFIVSATSVSETRMGWQ
ncbi:MAG: hypothetical protein K8R40_02680 [Anaerolineaceae bacterium]|nr:hypothetical protein [Anaerolineaceae bacterium]